MCETTDSEFPIEALGTGVHAKGDFKLTCADGNRPMAHFARSARGRGIGVVVIPARLGLLPFYKTLTERFAEIGVDAIAFDPYGRTAGEGPRDDGFHFEPHYAALTHIDARDGINIDVKAAVDYLCSPAGGEVNYVFTLGFCFGGSVSWWQSAVETRLSGCIGLYGAPKYVQDLVPLMRAPLLLLAAGDDQFVSQIEMSAFQDQLTAAGVEFEAATYAGAPHSFFDRRYAEHAAASEDAWDRMLRFIEHHTSTALQQPEGHAK